MVKKINHSEFKKVIEIHYEKKVSLMCYGGIGIGKSVVVREVAKEIAKKKGKTFIEWNKISDSEKTKLVGNGKNKFLLVDIRASQLDISDLRGLPCFNNVDKTWVEWKPNLSFRVLSQEGVDGIIFFDEVNCASPLVLSSLYQIFLDRAIGELTLNENVGIIGCGNRQQDLANVFEIPTPLRDRMSEIELKSPDIEKWTDFAFKNNVDSRIIAFLNFKPSRLNNVKTKSADKNSTPRSWVRCSHLISNLTGFEDLSLISGSTIGEGVAIEFSAFLKLKNKIDIKEILENPKLVEKLESIDLKYSLLSTATEYFKIHKEKKIIEQEVEICKYLQPEFSVLLLRMIKGVDKAFFSKSVGSLKNKKVLSTYAKFLL